MYPFFLSGQLDSGEDFLTAAVRETNEETGYVPEDLNIHLTKYFEMNQITRNSKREKTVIFWLAELKNVEKQPQISHEEHSEYRWLTKEQALDICKMPEFAELVNEFDEVAKTL